MSFYVYFLCSFWSILGISFCNKTPTLLYIAVHIEKNSGSIYNLLVVGKYCKMLNKESL